MSLPRGRFGFRLAALVGVALLTGLASSAHAQSVGAWSVAAGPTGSLSPSHVFPRGVGVAGEMSGCLHAFSVATLGIDLGGVFVRSQGDLVSTGPARAGKGRQVPGFGYLSMSASRDIGVSSDIAPTLRFSVGEWLGRTVNNAGSPTTTETGVTAAAEFGVRLGHVTPTAAYRLVYGANRGQAGLPSLLLRIDF